MQTIPSHVTNRKRFRSNHFGLIAEGEAALGPNREAASLVLRAITGEIARLDGAGFCRAAARVAHVFRSLSVREDRGWFLASEMLGHPSPRLAAKMAERTHDLVFALRSGGAGIFRRAVGAFIGDFGYEMLDSYANWSSGDTGAEEEGWAFILWSDDSGDILRVGVTDGNLRDAAGHRGGSLSPRCGVLSAWMVHDTERARSLLDAAFPRGVALAAPFAATLAKAQWDVEAILADDGNIVESAWHVGEDTDEDVVFAPCTKLAAPIRRSQQALWAIR